MAQNNELVFLTRREYSDIKRAIKKLDNARGPGVNNQPGSLTFTPPVQTNKGSSPLPDSFLAVVVGNGPDGEDDLTGAWHWVRPVGGFWSPSTVRPIDDPTGYRASPVGVTLTGPFTSQITTPDDRIVAAALLRNNTTSLAGPTGTVRVGTTETETRKLRYGTIVRVRGASISLNVTEDGKFIQVSDYVIEDDALTARSVPIKITSSVGSGIYQGQVGTWKSISSLPYAEFSKVLTYDASGATPGASCTVVNMDELNRSLGSITVGTIVVGHPMMSEYSDKELYVTYVVQALRLIRISADGTAVQGTYDNSDAPDDSTYFDMITVEQCTGVSLAEFNSY